MYSEFHPLKRYRPNLMLFGAFLTTGFLCVVFFLSDDIQLTWGYCLLNIVVGCSSVLLLNRYYLKGQSAWFSWDKNFVHVPALMFVGLAIFWLWITPDTKELTVLIWLGFYPMIYGRIRLLASTLYTSLISLLYLLSCVSGWGEPLNSNDITQLIFALVTTTTGFFFGVGSHLAAQADQSYLVSQLELEEALQKLHQTSIEDPLTGLLNRRGLRHYVKLLEDQSVAVYVIDIDCFKAYNDSYGHARGDECLKYIAHTLKYLINEKGIVARVGGEEFVVLLYGLKRMDAQQLAHQLVYSIKKLAIPHQASLVNQYVTVSLGASYSQINRYVFDDLWKEADQALYLAKHAGRDTCVFNDLDMS